MSFCLLGEQFPIGIRAFDKQLRVFLGPACVARIVFSHAGTSHTDGCLTHFIGKKPELISALSSKEVKETYVDLCPNCQIITD
jgi:hypothetical protein